MPNGTATAHLFKPKIATVWEEGYSIADFKHDAIAALTVAIIALPLSMAIAVGSGVAPERGLYTAIIGGFTVSLLSGSRFQIGGPAGAFIVLVSATVAKYGIDGLLLAIFMSGVLLSLAAITRLGSLIRYIPHAVAVGFTAGIAVTILASQLKDLGGLHLLSPEPGPLIPKLISLTSAMNTLDPATLALGVLTAALIFGLRRVRPHWPGMLIALIVVSAWTVISHTHTETIGSRFGGIPSSLPFPHLPTISGSKLLQMGPAALSFTLLGGIESLLSAKVADGMTGRRHRSNMELLAQGIANIASGLFGGISVTGTIARTAANIRAGGRTPVAGMLHALLLLFFIIVAAPLLVYIPLTALAGVLVTVAWNMVERDECAKLLREWRSAAVLLATFGLTVIKDLTIGIAAGCLLAAMFAIANRLSAERRLP